MRTLKSTAQVLTDNNFMIAHVLFMDAFMDSVLGLSGPTIEVEAISESDVWTALAKKRRFSIGLAEARQWLKPWGDGQANTNAQNDWSHV